LRRGRLRQSAEQGEAGGPDAQLAEETMREGKNH
jgi:hypothetical protein